MGERVEIGFVAKAHGIRGEIVIGLHDPQSTALERARELWIGGTAYAVEQVRHGNHGPLVALAGVVDRNASEALKGRPVEVAREHVAASDDILYDDLVGFEVRLADGTSWGTVVALELGAQDRLVIQDGAHERLLPIVDELITEIDTEAEVIVVAPPDDWPATPVRR